MGGPVLPDIDIFCMIKAIQTSLTDRTSHIPAGKKSFDNKSNDHQRCDGYQGRSGEAPPWGHRRIKCHNRYRQQLSLGERQRESKEKIVPAEYDAEQSPDRDARQGIGQDHPHKRPDRVAAVDHGHLVDLRRHIVEKVDHDPGGNRQKQGDINQNKAGDGIQKS